MEAWKEEALWLAKHSILEEFGKDDLTAYQPKSAELLKPGAAFVTLKTLQGNRESLRGCIGSLVAVRPLWQDIYINAKNAAFSDPRFPPLTEEETQNLKIEISVLTEPKTVKFNSIQELLEYLAQNKPGLIIKLGMHQATFLPSVWKELPDPEEFLVHLIYKAGLTPQEFIENFDKAEILVYDSIEFEKRWEEIE